MHWKVKAHALALLSRSPGHVAIYSGLRRIMGVNAPAHDAVWRARDLLALVRETARRPVGGTVLEYGTGWFPHVALLLRLSGATRVVTVDIHPWLTLGGARRAVADLTAELGQIVEEVNCDSRDAREWLGACGAAPTLEAWQRTAGIDYRCGDRASAADLLPGSVDVVCSSNVLEHVRPDTLTDLHRQAARVLAPGGVAAHRCNPGDHFAQIDSRVSSVHFLQYSKAQWRWYGSDLAYHNRLRASDHVRLIQASGLLPVVCRTRVDALAVAALSQSETGLHEDYAGYAIEDLATDYVWLGARKGGGVAEVGGAVS